MTTALVKSITDEQLEEVAGRTLSEVIELAESLGYIGWPIKAGREQGGPWVHRYDKRCATAGSITT